MAESKALWRETNKTMRGESVKSLTRKQRRGERKGKERKGTLEQKVHDGETGEGILKLCGRGGRRLMGKKIAGEKKGKGERE